MPRPAAHRRDDLNLAKDEHPGARKRSSPLFEDEERGGDDEEKTDDRVPAKILLEIENGKNGEDDESDDFLNGFELGCRKFQMADPVGRNLETVFDQGDGPADQDDFPEGRVLELQMAVPGDRHENIGNGQEENRNHFSDP